MPPETPYSQPAMPAMPPPSNPSRSWIRGVVVIVIALMLLAGVGYGISLILEKDDTSGTTVTATPAPAVTADERSRVSSTTIVSQLDVTNILAESGDIDSLLVKALQVAGDLTVSGNGIFTGSINAASFTGNGAGLTGVNASTLGGQSAAYYRLLSNLQGPLSDSQLSNNVALRNANNAFTGTNTFNGASTFSGPASFTTAAANSLTLGSPLGVGSGGTGGNNNAAARANLGAASSGVNADITALTGLTTGILPSQGGTGLTSVPNQGVLYGQGTATMGVALPAGANECLVSTLTSVQWGSCSGAAAGVSSLNSLNGALTLSDVTAAGNAFTINTASAATKGLASFSATNFSVIAGAVNTVQDITTGSSPTFAAINTNSITSASALAVGSTSQPLSLQGSTTSLSQVNGANTASLTFIAPAANVIYRLQTAAAGTYDVCSTAGNCVGVGGGVSTPGGTSNTIAKFTGTQTLGNSLLSDNGTLVTVGGNLSVTGNVTFSAALPLGQGGTGAVSLTTNGILLGNGTGPISSLVAGGAGQCLVSTIGAPAWQACPGSSGVSSFNGLTGGLTLANAIGLGSTVTINDATTSTKGIASFNATNFTTASGAVNTIQNIATTASPTFTAINTNTITPSSALTIGATGQSLSLQGNASTSLTATSGGSTTTVNFQAPAANVSYRFASTSAGSYDVCTTAGNCSGSGGATTSLSNLASVAINTALLAGTTTIDLGSNSAPFRDLFLGGTATNNFRFTGTATAARTITIPNASGTIAISASGPLSLDANGNITCAACVTSGGGGGGASAVDSLNGLTGALTIANASGVGSTITLNDATNGAKGIASFNASNFSVSSGAVNTIQNIATTASPTFTGVNTNAVTPSGALTLGATTQTVTLQGSDTTITRTNGANTASLTFVAPTSNVTYRFQTAAAGTYDVCSTAGNCTGVGGGVSTPGGSVNSLAKFTGTQTLGDSLLTDNGSLVTIGGNLSVTGTTTLSTALTVANGGTGAASLSANGVLLGNGTGAISSLVAGSIGDCLVSTAGAPVWQGCPGAGGAVDSLNTLTGTLTIANASTAGSTITIDNAGAATKGIASFNSTNFTVSSGAVNTIQNLATTSAPTFGGLTLTSALTVGNGGTGAATFTTNGVIFGNGNGAMQVTAAGSNGQCLVGNTGSAPSWATCTGLVTLQNAYANGNSISTTGNDIAFTLNSNQGFATTTAAGATGFSTFALADGANPAPPGQLILIRNNDTNQALASGLKITSAAGSITTAIDASGANITNAIDIGGNAISGTNFSVTGGGAVTAVGVNSGTGLVQGTGGITVSGAAASINTSSNFATNIGTGTSNGLVSIGGGSGTFALNTTNIDISNVGAISGATGLSSSGSIVFSGLSTGALYSSGGTLTSETNLAVSRGGTGAGNFTTNGVIYGNGTGALQNTAAGTNGQCLVGNTGSAPSWTTCTGLVTLQNAYANGNSISTSGTDIAFTLNSSQSHTVTTAAGATGFTTFALADGANPTPPSQLLLVRNNDINQVLGSGISVTSAAGIITNAINVSGSNITNAIAIGSNAISGTAFGVSNTGAVTAVGVNSGAGLIQGTAGLTTTGAASSINASSNFATSINTGTSNGTISLGGGSSPFQLNSTTFDVSTAGVLSGATGITSSGSIVFSGLASGALFSSSGTLTSNSFASGNVLLGNGTGAFQVVAPGASGNVLMSNGSTWVSSASSCSACIIQVPGSTAQNTISPTANSVVGLTVKATSGTGTDAFRVQNAAGSVTLFRVDPVNSLTNIQGTGTNGGGGRLTFGDSLYSYLGEEGTGDTDMLAVYGRSGISLQYDISSGGGVGINTALPDEALTVNGNIVLRNADTATKSIRVRTSGGNVDLESGGTPLHINVFNDADFSGTYVNHMIFPNSATAMFINYGAMVNRDLGQPLGANRTGNDGTLLGLYQDTVLEGSISVSGTTVSYNAFTGSHYAWSNETIERGSVVTMTGENRGERLEGGTEPIYGIKKTTVENDPAVMGSYLAPVEPSQPVSNDNPMLVMAVGNGDAWVDESGGNLEPGDPLITSSAPGHAMKDGGQYPTSYVFARAAEKVDWAGVTQLIGGKKHKKVSVLYGAYTQLNSSALRDAVFNGGIVAGDTTFNALVTFSSGVRFLGDATFEGNVAFQGQVTFSDSTAGSVTIPAGQLSKTITFTRPHEVTPVVNATPKDFLAGGFRVSFVTEEEFTIELSEAQPTGVEFNWNAIVVK